MTSLFKRRKRVLLLDDDPSMQRLVARILGNDGFRVDVFLTGSEAITAMATKTYDVLLLTASPDSLIEALSGEVSTVVQKPFEPKQLIDAVRLMSQS